MLAAAVFLATGADLARRSATAPLHVDEPRMLNRGFMTGRLYRDYLRTGAISPDWLSEEWQPRKPPLGNVIVALGLRLGGARPPAAPYQYDWRQDERWNAARGQVPAPEVLRAGRRLVPWFSAAAAAAAFLLGAGVGGVVGGLVAVALFDRNPVVQLYGSRALADMPMMAFSLWALWCLARGVAPAWEGPRTRLVAATAVLGLVIGLAAATKQNGAVMALVALAVFAVWTMASAARLGRRPALARMLLAASASLGVAYGVFVLVNPLLHAAPVTLTRAQVTAWNLKFAGHWKARPGSALRTPAARMRAVARVLAGNTFGTLGEPYVTALLLAAGALTLARRRGHPPRERGLPCVLLVWGCVTIAVVTAWIPLDWDRYYLPVIAVVAVVIGALGGLLPATVTDPARSGSRRRRDGSSVDGCSGSSRSPRAGRS